LRPGPFLKQVLQQAPLPAARAASDVEDPRTVVDRYIEPVIPSLPFMLGVVHVAMHHLTYPRNRAGERHYRGLGREATSGYA
jgi:hypothetical protein